jgi:hypothetical protein
MAFLGVAPFGSLLAGALAAHIGAPNTVLCSGALVLAGSFWFARQLPAIRTVVRPIYVKLGILPELAPGVAQDSPLEIPPED